MPRIVRVDTFPVHYPVRGAFKFFEGVPPRRPTLLVRVLDDEGNAGWGQAVPSNRWSDETFESVHSTIDRYLAPVLPGLECESPADPARDPIRRFHREADRVVGPAFSIGQPIAKSAVDLALHDWLARRFGFEAVAPAASAPAESVPLGWTVNPPTPIPRDALEAEIRAARNAGYASFNVKVGSPDPAVDLELVRLVRSAAPDAVLWADANGGCAPGAAAILARTLADLGYVAFEQPLPANRLTGYRDLVRLGAIPILMDEGIRSVVDLDEFHRLGCLDGLALKVARSAGLRGAFAQAELARDRGLLVLMSGLTDPDVALAASLRLAASVALAAPAALNAPQYLDASIAVEPVRVERGRALVPTGPGLGLEVDPSALDARSPEGLLPPGFGLRLKPGSA